MNIPYDSIIYLSDFSPRPIWPAVAFLLGLFHLFPLCCITSFVLGEIGITLQGYIPTEDWHQFNQMESDMYDPKRKMHLCRWHETKQIRRGQELELRGDLDGEAN